MSDDYNFDDFDDEFDDDFDDDGLDDNAFNDFDDDDPFGDDDFGFDDDFDDDDLGFDDDFDDDGFGDDNLDDAPADQQQDNFRTLVFAMAGLFVVGLIVIIVIVIFSNLSESAQDVAFQETSTAIVLTNTARETAISGSATAAIAGQTETLEAQLSGSQTAEAEARATQQAGIASTATQAVVIQTETQDAIVMLTQDAIDSEEEAAANATETAVADATEAAAELESTLNPDTNREPLLFEGQPIFAADGTPVILIDGRPFVIVEGQQVAVVPGSPLTTADGRAVVFMDGMVVLDGGAAAPTQGESVSLSAVQQTATRLAQLFDATPTQAAVVPTSQSIQPTQADAGPTAIIDGSGTGTGGTPPDTELPDTGLFDDVFGGNPMLIVMVAFGLLGVIMISRTARAANREQ